MNIRDGFLWNEVCASISFFNLHPKLLFLAKETTANVVKSNNNGPLGISPAQLTFSRNE